MSWARKHAEDNPGHSTKEGLDEPGACVTCGERSPAYNLPDLTVGRKRLADKASTRPQDWAPPARAILFGMETLNDEERAQEMRRRAAYPDRYGQRRR